jgi:putative membrane protein
MVTAPQNTPHRRLLLDGRAAEMDEAGTQFDEKPSVSNHFAWLRTQMALQNTLMAGVRTAVSLIGFGFTVAQFFERLQTKTPSGARQLAAEAPRNLGLTLIAAGVGLIAVFLWQFRVASGYLWSEPFRPLAGMDGRRLRSMPYAAAWVVLLIGLAAFVSIFARF